MPARAARGTALLTDLVCFVALLSTAVALAGALAHLLELPAKMGLSQDHYFIVQGIYRGWWQFAYVLAIQLLSILALMVLTRGMPRAFWPAVVALLCLVGAQAVFWIYTQPANAATDNWTIQPVHWETLRRQWEYSHATGAVLQLLAMSALIVAALARPR
jgi:hypothetical protein